MDWIIAFIKTQLRNYIGWGSVYGTVRLLYSTFPDFSPLAQAPPELFPPSGCSAVFQSFCTYNKSAGPIYRERKREKQIERERERESTCSPSQT